MLAQRDKHPSLILNNGEQHTTKLYELGCTPSTVVLHFILNADIEGSNPATGTGREKYKKLYLEDNRKHTFSRINFPKKFLWKIF